MDGRQDMRQPQQGSGWSDSNNSTRQNSAQWDDRYQQVQPQQMQQQRPLQPQQYSQQPHNIAITPIMEKGDHAGGHHDDHHGPGHIDINDPNRPKLSFKKRLHHFTWAWYTLVMSTGGLALLIFAQPHTFPGLKQIGAGVYAFNIVLFALVTSMLIARFALYPGDIGASIKHEREGFFLPTFFLSVSTLITTTERYVVPANNDTMIWGIQVAFYFYVFATISLALGQYSYVFQGKSFTLQTMMPTWILPIFPIMLSGTIASVIAEKQPDAMAIPIIVAGLTCQGLGLSVAVLMYAHMIGRLMQFGLPNREHRPGLFMNVGPPSFTALALIGMSKGLPNTLDIDGDGLLIDAGMIRTMALIAAVFLWALSFWWFGIATIAVLHSTPVYFHLGWWAMVFPNTGFVLATVSIGNSLQNDAVLWVGTGMSICLVLMYFFVLYHHVRAFIIQDIMYPGRDEDFNDH
ncbi:malic acid transport protein [Plectosphaerella plurivora]|uniref:Malic acid transport protein n=1 Tax=Plectosphaerella plurivora TaxID=936078 RepID=A0A9P8V6W6_9PEZI|nr:malic acid transport protein [Plectosphaerella plurivora]